MRNLLSRVPQSAYGWVAPLVRTIFEQPDRLGVGPARPCRRTLASPGLVTDGHFRLYALPLLAAPRGPF